MKKKTKQKIILVICAVLLLIPSYIAVSSYYVSAKNVYELEVKDENKAAIGIADRDTDRIAKMILKLNSRLVPTDQNVSLPSKYYSVTMKENGAVICELKLYLIPQKNMPSYAVTADRKIYAIRYKDAKPLLSSYFSSHFYDNSELPVLSVNGGDEIAPSKSKWSYREVGGGMIDNPHVTAEINASSYSIVTFSDLSFSLKPKDCSVKLLDGEMLLGEYPSLESVPTSVSLEPGIKIEINAIWDGANYEGNAHYEFYCGEYISPSYTVHNAKVSSGEFFYVSVKNVNSPHNIEFSSLPEIYATPVFFPNGDAYHALIPVKKELATPCAYTFTFKYGNDVQSFTVTVEPRAVRNDKECNITLPINESELERVNELLCDTALESVHHCFWKDGFLDYSPDENASARLAEVYYGFGHTVISTNGLPDHRLDGVIYMFPVGSHIPSVCPGRVIKTGNDPFLGLYVAIDHGSGLITWYCNMSAISVNPGDSVKMGETVGISGDTGFDGINGVYLITTAGGIPVSPYPLQQWHACIH